MVHRFNKYKITFKRYQYHSPLKLHFKHRESAAEKSYHNENYFLKNPSQNEIFKNKQTKKERTS